MADNIIDVVNRLRKKSFICITIITTIINPWMDIKSNLLLT